MKNIIITTAALLLFSFASPRVSFTLRNETEKSIPLQIPGVMNPNLSPMSNSGVTLKIGQEIYFFPKGKSIFKKKELLLTVTEELAGKTLKVNELIEKRIEELEDEGMKSD